MNYVTRFAPSPTGPLHLGHAYSAVLAWRRARAHDGIFLLRIEDTDPERSRPEWEALILKDLAWLGLEWPEPVLRQSRSRARYDAALDRLAAQGLIYPCRCARADIRAALSAPQEGVPLTGPDGLIYPGTCRGRPLDQREPGDALRLDISRALDSLGTTPLGFEETGSEIQGFQDVDAESLRSGVGDVVLGRKGTGAIAYHLAVVVDDAYQAIAEVIRGADLFEATPLHVLLQALLGLPTPSYHHHRLIRDANGKRLAKRDDAKAIRTYRESGKTAAEVLAMVGLA